jgi:hypothetical protein
MRPERFAWDLKGRASTDFAASVPTPDGIAIESVEQEATHFQCISRLNTRLEQMGETPQGRIRQATREHDPLKEGQTSRPATRSSQIESTPLK